MELKILSHAGLQITAGGKSLLCDPWLIGSTYWRSWWNYPPVERDLIHSLEPDAIYLTHVHWDHFAGPSLRLFNKTTPIIIPKEPAGRIARDLRQMKFENVIELAHGESYQLWDIKLTSYHFFVFTDSAVVIEADDTVVLNANDAKLMGGPLKQVLRRHPKIDFVLRSHSSANSRICYEITDDPYVEVDDREVYIQNFAEFVQATGARHAIPFASNHCHLHREVYKYNDFAVSQQDVADFFAENDIVEPELHVMVSGDSWETKNGFDLQEHDWFSNRHQRLREYQAHESKRLERTYAREDRAKVRMPKVERYFEKVFDAMPWPMRRMFKHCPLLYVLTAGETTNLIAVDFHRRTVKEVDSYTDESHPFQIHTKTALFNHCMGVDLFSHLAISKRVRYRMPKRMWRNARLLAYFYNFYEWELLPLRSIRPLHFLGCWLRRWREILLYGHIAFDLARGKGFEYRRYLNLPAGAVKSASARGAD